MTFTLCFCVLVALGRIHTPVFQSGGASPDNSTVAVTSSWTSYEEQRGR